jgi:hypothetical protein
MIWIYGKDKYTYGKECIQKGSFSSKCKNTVQEILGDCKIILRFNDSNAFNFLVCDSLQSRKS